MNGRRALVVAPTLPEHDRQGGSRDIADLIDFLRDDGWAVAFAASSSGEDRHVRRLRRLGVDVHVTKAGASFALPEGPRPDLVIIAFWHLAEEVLPVIRRRWPAARVIVSSIDLHFVRSARRIFGAVARGDRSFLLDSYYADDLIRELNTYAAADAVLTVSEKEAALVNDLTGDADLAWCVPVTQGETLSPYGFADRQGVLFVGNFLHEPNVEAVLHLCREVLPLVDPHLLQRHPVRVVGNAPDDRVARLVEATPGAELVGWVPSLTPYLHQARACVVPLLHGAGVKGKLVRALAAGTPTVSTSIGVEGLDLEPGAEILVADDPADFADGIERLLSDRTLWLSLSTAGHRRIAAVHGDAAVQARLMRAVDHVMSRPVTPAARAAQLELGRPRHRYGELARKLCTLVERVADVGDRMLVVSKGDDDLLDLGAISGEHFPHDDGGGYLGWHPSDTDDVRRRLDAERQIGPHHLVLPQPLMWWLDHYDGLREYLDEHYRLVLREDDTCLIWRYPNDDLSTSGEVAVPIDEATRPAVTVAAPHCDRLEVLTVGIYLASTPNHADDVAAVLSQSRHSVTQRWVALGGPPPTPLLAENTSWVETDLVPKFELLNRVLIDEDLARYDFVVLVDDDIRIPRRFIDELLGWQRHLEFALAQPARTSNSYTDHRIVEQQRGTVARRTRFVEIGPVVSIHRSAFDLILPFDLTSPMGWGYENVWSLMLEAAGLSMGIIDAVPVDHSLRPPVANYSWDDADLKRASLLASRPHRPLEECYRVLDIVAEPDR